MLAFNTQPIPITSMDSEIGSLREIQEARISNQVWSRASSYMGFTISGFVAVICISMTVCYCLLKENRNRHGVPPPTPGMLSRVKGWMGMPGVNQPYRQTSMELRESEVQEGLVT